MKQANWGLFLWLVAFVAIVVLSSAPARGEGGLLGGGQKVRINLKNGAVFEGLIRKGGTFERLDKGWFRPVKENEALRDDGVRIWYPGYTQGFVFVRKKDIRTLEKLDHIGADEAAEIEQIVAEKAKRALETYDQVLRARERSRAETRVAAELAQRAQLGDGDSSPLDEQPQLARAIGVYPLLDRYPPEDGWGEEKADRLERRKWLIGAFPNSDEKGFLLVFRRWSEQYHEWLATAARAPAPVVADLSPPPGPTEPAPAVAVSESATTNPPTDPIQVPTFLGEGLSTTVLGDTTGLSSKNLKSEKRQRASLEEVLRELNPNAKNASNRSRSPRKAQNGKATPSSALPARKTKN